MIKATEIWIRRAEGPHALCTEVTLTGEDLWAQADKVLRKSAKTAPKYHGTYDKHDFRVTFEDGETYEGRYDVHYNEHPDLAGHIIDFVRFMAGMECPSRLSQEQYLNYLRTVVGSELMVESADWLERYEVGSISGRNNIVGPQCRYRILAQERRALVLERGSKK